MKTVVKNKVCGKKIFGKLTKSEIVELKTPIKQLNFKYANREHAYGYMKLLENKINAIREISRLGKDFDDSIKFDSQFVYKLLVDAWQVMDDYLRLKDEFLYIKYSKIEKEKLTCESCKVEKTFHEDIPCVC